MVPDVSYMRQWIEIASIGIELLAVAVIVGSVMFGSVRLFLDLSRRATDPYGAYKGLIGRSLLLGLEFLVVVDVIRTFLSWSVVVETEGHWPWQPRPSGQSG